MRSAHDQAGGSRREAVPVPVPLGEPATGSSGHLPNESRNQVLHPGEAVAIEVEVKNEGPGTAWAVEFR